MSDIRDCINCDNYRYWLETQMREQSRSGWIISVSTIMPGKLSRPNPRRPDSRYCIFWGG